MTRQFGGFLVATEPSVAIPHAFFSDVLPQIKDPAEIHVTLAVFRLSDESGGIEQPVADHRIKRDPALRAALRTTGSPRAPDARIESGLDLAVGRGTVLKFASSTADGQRLWYYVNTPANKGLVAAMARGAVDPPPPLWDGKMRPEIVPERPNVFRLYEQNVGLLTPLIADQLIDALERFPSDWVEDAILEAVSYNKRSWRYIQRILEQWEARGRGDGREQDGLNEANRRRHEDHIDSDQYRSGRHLNRARRA